jgi:hypothetical protein
MKNSKNGGSTHYEQAMYFLEKAAHVAAQPNFQRKALLNCVKLFNLCLNQNKMHF